MKILFIKRLKNVTRNGDNQSLSSKLNNKQNKSERIRNEHLVSENTKKYWNV